ncbi:MAG: AbrB family transcriptional regulator [Oceanicola sp.]|jgi:membrane AbrB-like protein|nr:AbrB family transcriptional regulator [Oceanicola sp.]
MRKTPTSPDLRWIGIALLLGTSAGGLAAYVGLPLPWMLGPMIGCTLAALAGMPLVAPGGLRQFVIPVIGVFLGASFHGDMLEQAASWGITAALLPLFCIAAATISYAVYRMIGRYDPITAFFSAMPGGLSEMMLLGDDAGGDGRRIALAHATRVLLVIASVALFFGLVLGVDTRGSARNWVTFEEVGLRDGAALAACALLGLGFARGVRLPAGALFGPMILSAALHISGLVTVPPPTLLVVCAQIFIGTVIGCRFVGVGLREVAKDMALGAVAASGMLAIALFFAQIVYLLTERPIAQAFLAFSPGGLTEMSLLALAMGQEVAYVASAHIARITLVIFSAPVAFRIWGSARRRAEKSPAQRPPTPR